MTWRQRWAGVFGLDSRSLALFRIGLGLLLIQDAMQRLLDVGALFADDGVVPPELVPWSRYRHSLLFLTGSAEAQGAWLLLLAAVGVAITLGWRTRWMKPLAWVLVCSVQARSPLVLYGGDVLLRMLLFWSLFLPLDGQAAVRPQAAPRRVLGLPAVAYVLQVFLMYAVTLILKDGPPWWNGTAVHMALQVDIFTHDAGRALLAWPAVTAFLTWFTVVVEIVGTVLILSPWGGWRLRVLVMAVFAAFHLGTAVTMAIALFPWVSLLCWVPLIPSEVWDRLGWRGEVGEVSLPAGLRWARDGVVAVALLAVIWWNLGSLGLPAFAVRGTPRAAIMSVYLDQYWNMYAPEPLRDDGWWVLDGTTVDGRQVDLLSGGALTSFDKPTGIAHRYGGPRWRKHMRSLWEKRHAKLRTPYLRWACQTWNDQAEGGDVVQSVEMVWLLERTPLPGQAAPPPKPIRLQRYACPEG